MLHVRQVSYHPPSSDRALLREVSLSLSTHEIGVIVGRSGAGKSTLLELIAGLARPTSGAILWQDQVLTPAQLRRLAGLVFQFPERHFCTNSIQEELRFGHPQVTYQQMETVLAQVGLAGIPLTDSPFQLSGGQQRRLSLAVQLIRNPFLLLLDEPTAGLDWSVRQQILQLLGSLKSDWTMLIVTHDPKELAGLASRQWRLQQGALEELTEPGVEDLS
ncbi:MAG: ABC transporter ATP-binding protein [Thermostichales cyanobacterium BF4_bins_65]